MDVDRLESVDRVERVWRDGPTCVVIASGPSLTEADVLEVYHHHMLGSLSGVKCGTVNDCYRLAPWADFAYAGDWTWWDHHLSLHNPDHEKLERMERWTTMRQTQTKHPGVRWVQGWNERSLSDDPARICWGRNSGYQAINIALLKGARRIVLLGFDMKFAPDGKKHWFGDHPTELHPKGGGDPQRWVGAFDDVARGLEKFPGATVVNATRDTALTQFPRMTIQEALQPAVSVR